MMIVISLFTSCLDLQVDFLFLSVSHFRRFVSVLDRLMFTENERELLFYVQIPSASRGKQNKTISDSAFPGVTSSKVAGHI